MGIRFLFVVVSAIFGHGYSETLAQEGAKDKENIHAAIVALSGDARLICAKYAEGFVCIWDIKTGNLLQTFRTPHYMVMRSMKFSEDGKLLAMASSNEAAQVWDVAKGKEVGVFRYDASFESLSFSEDGSALAIATHGNTVRVWKVADGNSIRTFKDASPLIHLSRDGKTIFLVEQGQHVTLRNTGTGKEVLKIKTGESPLSAIMAGSDSKVLVTGHADKMIRIWEVATGKELGVLRGHTGVVMSVAIGSEGKLLMSYGLEEKTARVWDLEKQVEVRTFKVEGPGGCNLVAIDGTGKYLAAVSFDDTARVWETSTGKEIRVFRGTRPEEKEKGK
jgi:WD40 repeat protein